LRALRHRPALTPQSSSLLSLVRLRLADYHCEQPAHSFHLSLLQDSTSPLGPTNIMTLTHSSSVLSSEAALAEEEVLSRFNDSIQRFNDLTI
jgi:hypothetical protein